MYLRFHRRHDKVLPGRVAFEVGPDGPNPLHGIDMILGSFMNPKHVLLGVEQVD